MTSETYLDLTFDRSAKSGKRPIRPKLLKLTDVTMPHRNRKKTKVKSKDRAASSVRDRIYDDPAYTDDISHLANPTRRSSCSGKGESKGAHGGASTSLGGSSSLGKRSKLTKEFLQYAKQGKGRSSAAVTLTTAGVGSYENDGSSSSDEPQRSETVKGGASLGRRGRSLERSMASGETKSEKKREKRERNSKQKRNLSLDNSLQQQEIALRALDQLDMHSMERRAPRSKESRKSQLGVPKQYSDGSAEQQWSEERESRHLPPTPADERDELFSVHSASVSNATVSKMQIGRRFLRGEIGIKSFNYYLLKEGLKSSKKFVEKQRNSLTGGLGGASSKKLHSRSEENIYEEIFFKDAPPSDEENQNQVVATQQPPPPQQQHQKHQQAAHAGTPLSQCSTEDGIYADCELCMQQCTKKNCDYCYVAPTGDNRVGNAARTFVAVQHQQPALLHGKLQQQPFDSLGRPHAPDGPRAVTTAVGGAYINPAQQPAAPNGNNNANNLSGGPAPTAHILEFQSYNPNNPGVYKIETTPVAITGEYNPILQFQQSSPSTNTTTTTTPSDQLQQQHQHHQLLHRHAHLQQQHYTHQQQPLPPPPTQQQQQQQQQLQQQYKSLAQGYVLQAGTAVPLTAAALTNSHYQPPAGPIAGGVGAVGGGSVLPLRTRSQRGHQQQQQQHYIVSYNGVPQAATTTSAGASASASGSMQRMNTKSSSSSDSLQQQQQQLHKHNTMARLEAQNVLVSDPFYGGRAGSIGAGVAGTPLMYAASRPIGGSQILVDPYELPQMYKSDSRASILSEYSLRSSDNSHRYNHRYRYGRGEISDSSLGDSLLSYNSAHRRYFGSSESCRFAFECRRCSLDGGEKCSYSDTCRYECRNCDCSSSYFSSDFDDMYGSMPRSSGIPRKTAAGTLPANVTSEYERQQEQLDLKQNKYAQDFFKHVNDVKRSIYQSEMQRNGSSSGGGMDAPKSAAAAPQQTASKSKSKCTEERSGGSPRRHAAKELQSALVPPACATLPLTKERARQHANEAGYAIMERGTTPTPTPAPRTSLQQTCNLPQPTQRRATSGYERHEYPSLDRLVASATGAIPKTTATTTSTAALATAQIGNIGGKQLLSTKNNATNTMENNNNNNNSVNTRSPQHSPKIAKAARSAERAHRTDGTAAAEARSHHTKVTSDVPDEQPAKRERYLNIAGAGAEAAAGGGSRRHHRASSSSKQSSAATSALTPTSSTRRSKDVPAPPPPSPATYSDLQELKANLECVQQDGHKTQQKTKKHSKKDEATANEACEQQQKIEQQMVGRQPNVVQTLPSQPAPAATTKPVKTKYNSGGTTTATKMPKDGAATAGEQAPEVAAVTAKQGVVGAAVGGEHVTADTQQQQQARRTEDTPKRMSPKQQKQQQQQQQVTITSPTTKVNKMPERSNNTNNNNNTATDTSTQNIAEVHSHSDANDDDDVFYDARSEDSAGTAASAASSGVLLQAPERRQRRRDAPSPVEAAQQQQQENRQQQQRAASGKAPQNDQKPCERSTKDTNAGPLKDTSGAEAENANENANNEAKKTAKKLHSDAQLLNVAESGQGATSMALNLAEAAIIHTSTPTAAAAAAAAAVAATVTPTTPTATDQKDSSAAATATAITSTRKEKKHERRSSRQSGSSSNSASRQQQQHRTSAITLTISCDTCCQLECEQQQLHEQQQELKQQKSNEARAKKQSKSNAERASKINGENDNNNTNEEREKLPTTTIITTVKTATSTRTTIAGEPPASTPTSCAATLLPATTNAEATKAAPALAAASTAADTCHKYDTQSQPTTTATEPGTGAEIGAQTASNNKMSANAAATCSAVDGKTSLTTTTTTTTTTATVVAAPTTTTTTAAVDTIPVVAVTVDNGNSSIASAANSAVSCNSDGAGVATVSFSNNEITQADAEAQDKQQQPQQQQQQQLIKRAPLYRQEHSACIDSSEPQSDDSHLTRDSITRESQNDELSSSTHDKIDVSTLPLPALPPKKRRTRLRASPSRHHSRRHEHELPLHAGGGDEVKIAAAAQPNLKVVGATSGAGNGSGGEAPHLSAFQQYVAKRRESLEASSRHFNEKLEARRMHYHTGGVGGGGGGGNAGSNLHMPTYLFGEHYYSVPASGRKSTGNKEEIFLNKSGWVQVNTKRSNDENRSGGGGGNYRRANYAHQNGSAGSGSGSGNTIRVIQIDNTRRSDMARQALLQHQHSVSVDPKTGMPVYNISKYPNSKVEELIQRNEARLNTATGQSNAGGARDNALRPGYRIVDPQLANILNERPGFLPVKNLHDADSPPPITPILSPPPAFQDSSKSKYFDRRKTIPTRQQAHQVAAAVINTNNLHTSNGGGAGPGKGMVFSRSFEYDTRRNTPADTYVETFSRSFDGNLSERHPLPRERSPNFSTLTGNSPNYLSKKDSGGGSSGSLRSRDSSPKYQQPQTTAYLNASIKEAPPAYSLASSNAASNQQRYSPRARHERSFERSKSHNALVRSRKSQFNRVASSGPAVGAPPTVGIPTGMSRFRSFDTTMSQRLNSCDSGARSDLSNDELDCDDDEGSSEFLTTTNYHHSISPLKTPRQRSLTPDRNESHSSSSSLRKQRSLTPESRSLTPEDRRKKTGSQASLMGSRQNSSSRSNTLERKQRLEEKSATNISRSSSSSSYSGGEHEVHPAGHLGGGSTAASRSQHRRSLGRNAKQADEHRIRRSRSLQLSERSPNRSHKMIVSVGQSHPSGPQPAAPAYQQANMRTNGGGGSNFPPTIRTSGKSQSILLGGSMQNGSGRIRSSDIDKSRSFDFDYCNYNNTLGATTAKGHVGGSGGGGGGSNQNVPMRLDFDKSRSFDDDYREPINSNNNLGGANGIRYLQTAADVITSGGNTGRLRRTSPVAVGGGSGGERNSRSPQSSGSSCNNLNLPRQSTSPQNYGTRLCDHELTYDMLRKSLDRSPIMDFRRGDSSDYDLPPTVIRNRETINAGGNSELNFFSNDAHIYEQPTTTITTSASGAGIKQQRSLGHTQSPSESQYSLERLHSSRDSITPDGGGGSEYRGDYIYRQTQSAAQRENARGSSRGSSQKNRTTTTTTPPTKTTTTTRTKKCPIPKVTNTKATVKSPTSRFCSFWPHCGACNAAVVKRQSSLQSAECQSARNMGTRPCGLPLRRNHSAHLPPERERHFHDISRNVSTVSVNVQVKPMQSNNDEFDTVAARRPSKSQWTLLCSGATPTHATKTAATTTTRASTGINSTLNGNAIQTPRVIPLAATSLVFLGDCEMPITRERDYTHEREREREREHERNVKRTTIREGAVQAAADGKTQIHDGRHNPTISKSRNDKRTPAATAIPTGSTATTKCSASIASAKQCGYSAHLCNRRSRSLPDIAHVSGLTNTATANDDLHSVGARSSFSTSLSHQMRAVSSPSLTDAIQQDAVQVTSMQLASTSATSSVSGESTPTATGSSNNSASLSTSQSVGVLQKFKRTLTNFNKNPQQQQQQQVQQQSASAATNNAHPPHSAVPLVLTAAAAAPGAEGQHDTTAPSATSSSTLDAGASSKYRFGPLIWRSSKERRKTKYNRRDKCNSGDSGIQIELENDEQFSRMMTAAGGDGAAAVGVTAAGSSSTVIALGSAAEEMLATPKLRSVRRTSSAKASSIADHATTAMSAKAKILKRMELCTGGEREREAPESLPTRSLSQPNGLETFGIGRADLDDSDSDSVASHDEGPNYYPIYAEVLYSFTAAGPQELGLERGTLIEILRKEVGPWWFGRIKKEESTLVEEILDPELGWFPKEFVRVIQCPETDTFFLSQIPNASAAGSLLAPATSAATKLNIAAASVPTAMPQAPNSTVTDATDAVVDENNVTTIVIESPSYNAISQSNSNGTSGSDCNALAPSRSINVILDSADVLRRSAVKELLDTEVNYVKLLASICEGYLPAMSKRIDIFSPNSIRLIFSNIMAIYKFQRKFLEALRKGIEQNQIAKVFLKMHKGFLCYSTYCNAYPRALIELESYDRVKDAKIILDNCRESENLAELPLSAHLLAPVQRICRYPLHLAEIIKSAAKCSEEPAHELAQFEQLDVSQLDIPDTRDTIDMALEAMKSITEAVNEGKRHSETIARHQASFQNFKGPPLHLHSTRFFLQIDATRQKQNLWNSSCTLFLFDNQLIYCKRDIIKRSQFIYKGRIFLDRCRVVNVRDGKMFGHTIKNSLRIYCEARDKWYDFSFRSANRKHRFLSTLALERQFGGKALYVSEMTGFEYAFEERDYSDQSDYEMPESENSIGIGGLAVGQRHWSMADVTTNGTSASGDSSVPESPVKYKYSDTLPKKSQTREVTNGGGGSAGTLSAGECQTGSLGRRRLGNWFRKPKSSNSTPNHSPTHKPPQQQQPPFAEQSGTGAGDGVSDSHETAGTTTIEISSSSSA